MTVYIYLEKDGPFLVKTKDGFIIKDEVTISDMVLNGLVVAYGELVEPVINFTMDDVDTVQRITQLDQEKVKDLLSRDYSCFWELTDLKLSPFNPFRPRIPGTMPMIGFIPCSPEYVCRMGRREWAMLIPTDAHQLLNIINEKTRGILTNSYLGDNIEDKEFDL